MCSIGRIWTTVACSSWVVVYSAGLLASSGCNPHKDQLRPENLLGRISRPQGQLIEPRKCLVQVAFLNRAVGDSAINQAVWKVADEQAIPPEQRRALEANGLRLGRITGDLPPELDSILKAPPPHKVEPAKFFLDDGDQTLINATSDAVDQVSLLMNRENRAFGKDYKSANGHFRVTASQQGEENVSVRITPEIHHGPIQRSFQPLSATNNYNPQQFKINDGQEQEVFADLAATVMLKPGQIAVVGCRPELEGSLGGFLMTQAESRGDTRRQKLILIWASRNQVGVLANTADANDRPVLDLFRRKSTPDESPGRPATPKPPQTVVATSATDRTKEKAATKSQ